MGGTRGVWGLWKWRDALLGSLMELWDPVLWGDPVGPGVVQGVLGSLMGWDLVGLGVLGWGAPW